MVCADSEKVFRKQFVRRLGLQLPPSASVFGWNTHVESTTPYSALFSGVRRGPGVRHGVRVRQEGHGRDRQEGL